MEDNTMPKRMLQGSVFQRRNGTPRIRWLDDVESDLKQVKGWKEMKNREQWRLVVQEAKAYPGL
jgi:hypothetical protein